MKRLCLVSFSSSQRDESGQSNKRGNSVDDGFVSGWWLEEEQSCKGLKV